MVLLDGSAISFYGRIKAEGYEGRLETAAEGQISEAGAALQGGQQAEFFGFLAALAPMLISSVGPALVKAVSRKLSPKTRRAVSIIAKRAPGPIGVGATKLSQVHGLSGLAPLIARLFESAAEGGEGFAGETGEESAGVNEALVSETAAAMEVIIGSDDRIRINNTTSVPWRRYCALRIYFPSGAQYRGTGFLIGPRALATAGHCVYMRNQGGWARRIEVIPGCNGSQKPFGSAMATEFRSTRGWVQDGLPESDYGCIFLPNGSFGGTSLGSFGAAAFDTQTLLAQNAVLAGYPGDKPFAELWGMSARIKAVTAKTLIYDIDSVGGQSGAPVYIKRSGVRYVVGIHNYGAGRNRHWSAIYLEFDLAMVEKYARRPIAMELPNRRIEVSGFYYERKYGGAPPGVQVDLSFAAILADLGLSILDHHDVFADADRGSARDSSCTLRTELPSTARRLALCGAPEARPTSLL